MKAPVSSPQSNKAHVELSLLHQPVYPVPYQLNSGPPTKMLTGAP